MVYTPTRQRQPHTIRAPKPKLGTMRHADLPLLPHAPGVYIFKNARGVLYVGKAKDLRARVSSYFHADEGKAQKLIQAAEALEYIVTRDEVEALLLEANLIKSHRPPFNVLLKDDKHYPFLKLTNEPFPTLRIVRRIKDDGARYWGPFPNAGTVRKIKDLIDRTFPLRKNSGVPMKKRRKPCLNYAMGRCLAPCAGLADPKAYRQVVHNVERVLSGEVDALIRDLEAEMNQAARETNFERAATLRDQIRALKAFFATEQQAVLTQEVNLDFLGFARAGAYATVQLFQLRSGRILGRVSRFVEGVEEASDQEILAAFLRDYYLEATPLPKLVLLPFEVEGQSTLATALTSRAGRKVALKVPKRGEKKKLIQLAQKNAQSALETEMARLERKGDHPALKALAEVLALSARPYRIEGFDVSTLFGEATVAAIVVFEGGRPKRRDYRHLRIRSQAQADDYAAIEEAVYRRFAGRLSETMPVPDLLLIDGGLGQVRAALRGLERAKIAIPTVGLAKREETLILPSGEAIRLPLHHPALRLLIYIRDEAHRTGVRRNRKLRRKKALRSIFEDIPGIGEQRRRVLLESFDSLEEIRQTPLETLAKLPGMNRKAAAALKAALEAEGQNATPS